ncbi:MAG: hypothetical protein IKC70_01815 [Bacteroidaceae bacterium]|nr:hypothetical protein [Bacteroidaceae bacterium]
MRKNLLLTCLLTLIATIGMAQSTSFPITLTSADGLPGQEVPGNTGVYIYKTPVYTLDEPITSLRYTVAQTLSSTVLPTNADGYGGRMTDGPGFPFFSVSELTVYDADGNVIEYSALSNAEHPTDGGGLTSINDGIRQAGNHFHTNWYNGPIDDDYHYVELEFVDEVQSFSIEWSTRYGYPHNQPVYVGLTEGGTSYWPMPEQELKVEKISTLDQLAEPNSLFVIEGHVEPWWDEARQRENVGGGFFEAPCLTTKEPSAFGVFTLIPVEGAENTYKVEYINTDHYIVKRGSYTGYIDWTMDIRKAMDIQFAQHADINGDFTLTANNGELLLMQDAIMRMGCFKNDAEEIAKFDRPYATNFSIYKADIKASTILYKLEDVIANVDSRIAELGSSLNSYDEDGFKTVLETALASAKTVAAKGTDVTVAEIFSSRNTLNTAFNNYYALTLNMWVDSIANIIDAMDEGLILTSSAPDWINNSYPAEYTETLIQALDEAEIAFESYETIADIDDAVSKIKGIIDTFWASKITNVKSLPFRIGREEDGLPGKVTPNDGSVNRWESPTYYLTDMVDQLRFTVFQTLSGRQYNGKPHPAIIEFELYDENGQKIELTEESFSSNSVSPTWGWGYKALCDGNYSLDSRFESITGDDQGEFDGSEYVYLDVELPREIGGFKFVLYGRGGSAYQDGPIDFVFGYVGETVTPATVLFPDDYNAMRGAQVESIEEITDNGIYAIYGLLGCSPEVGGDPEDGGFYTSGKRWVGALQSPCAFSIRSTGDEDGTYYIQSLADGKYWASSTGTDGDYWEGGSTTHSLSKAAKVKIESNENDENLPFSFRIYEYIEESYRNIDVNEGDSVISVKTHCPYVIAQDWGNNLGWYPVDAFENNDKDGEGEWFIYKMSMDTPFSYWLGNMTTSLMDLGFVQSNDPGAYKDLKGFPEACAKAQTTAEAKDEAASKAMIKTLEAAFAEIENAETNPVVAGYYVFEANTPEYFQKQGVNKAIYAMPPHEGCLSDASYCEEYEIGWKTSPEDIMEADSMFVFELVPAAADDENVAIWLEDSLITAEQAPYAYYLRSVKYNKYITCSRPEDVFIDDKAGNISWWGIHLSLSDAPQAFMVLQRERTAFDIWMPGGSEYSDYENGNLALHQQGHSDGNGKEGHIVFWKRGDARSLWKLRFIGENFNTSIDAPVVEGAEVVSTTYYTIDGVASQTPVQGVNVVKYVYSNGVVKTVKVLK